MNLVLILYMVKEIIDQGCMSCAPVLLVSPAFWYSCPFVICLTIAGWPAPVAITDYCVASMVWLYQYDTQQLWLWLSHLHFVKVYKQTLLYCHVLYYTLLYSMYSSRNNYLRIISTILMYHPFTGWQNFAIPFHEYSHVSKRSQSSNRYQ